MHTLAPTKDVPATAQTPTRVRYGVLAFACALAMITYLDRFCMATVAPYFALDFKLNDSQLGTLLASFNLAYALFEVPTGWLGDVFGPRRTLIRIVLWWSAFTALTGAVYPSVTSPLFMFWVLVSVRFLFGVGEAGAFPNITRAFHNWFPLSERGTVQGVVWMAGRFAGGVSPAIVVFFLYETHGDLGEKVTHWRHTFWIFGGVGIVWCIAFWWWFRDHPEEKAGVNAAEIALIRCEHEQQQAGHSGIPWKRFLTSWNLWSLCLIYFGSSYGWYFHPNYLPRYLNDQYGVTKDTPFYSLMAGAPLLLGALACLVGGVLTDVFIRRTGNRKWGRRLFGLFGHGSCAACFFLSIFAPSAWLFVLAMALASFFNDLAMGATWASCQDIGRRYAATVAGSMNMIGNFGGFLATKLIGTILFAFRDPVLSAAKAAEVVADPVVLRAAGREAWVTNFIIIGVIYVCSALLWLTFDSTKPVVPDEPAH